MLQDANNGKMPKPSQPDIESAAVKAGAMVADKVAEEAGGKVKDTKNKIRQGAKIASQVASYAGVSQQLGSSFSSHGGTTDPSSGVADGADPAPQSMGNNNISTAAAIAASGIFGVSHLVKLTIFVEGEEISHYKNFQLSQTAIGHHNFSLVLGHDSLGKPQDHEMAEARKLLGKSITVTFSYKNVSGTGPERNFVGVITQVGFSREQGNRGNIVLKGNSPTVLLDGAPHIQSFGGAQVVSLFTIANTLLQEGLGSKYDYKIDPGFTNNISYSCQYDETHYNYLARTAESYGEQFFYDGQALHFGKLPPPEDPITLTFGKDVDEIDIQMRTRHVNRSLYGYNSSTNDPLSTGQTKVEHKSSLAKEAYDISEKTFLTPSTRIAPMKAGSNEDVKAAQKSATGSEAVNVFVTTGKTSVPFLYPGCLVQMYMRHPDSAEVDYLTKLMITDIHHSVDALGNYTGYFEAIAADTGYLPAPVFHIPIAESQIAIVTNNSDGQGRVQVKFDWQTGSSTTEWIRVMSPDAGSSGAVAKNRGLVFIPEKDDQVMVGFVHSHPDRPYVMGGLFHGQVGGGGGSGNNIKSLSSKSGHTIELNDAGGITIKDKSGVNIIVLDGTDKISVTAGDEIKLSTGSASITLKANGDITISGTKVTTKGTDFVNNVSGDAFVKVVAEGNKADLNGKATTVTGEETAVVTAKDTTINGDAKTGIKSAGPTSIEGAIVKLN